MVNSTGTVQPVLSVQVGAFVSGPIQKVCVDFNDKVKKDQILAQIDPRNYVAAEAHESAALAHAQADLKRVQALLEHAVRFEQRNIRLKKKTRLRTTISSRALPIARAWRPRSSSAKRPSCSARPIW